MDLTYLYAEILKSKNKTLMEEPCPLYEPEWEDATEEDWMTSGITRINNL
jgi:hypothetical protein